MRIKKIILAIITLSIVFLLSNVKLYASNSYFLMGCTVQNIPNGYYSSVDTTVGEAEFRQNLHDIISANYVKKSYDEAWNIDSYADADPYNEGHIQCLYTDLSVENGSHTPSGDKLYWNREHTWPKSHGFNKNNCEPYTDCHHLRASESKINIAKSNNDFGELTSDYTESYGNKYGNGVFEPRDEVKGDVARMLLYMAIRYGEYDDTTFTVTENDVSVTYPVNLTLVDDCDTTEVSTGNGKLAKLSTLIKWHYQDPVSSREIYRNNVVYMFQKNRNPFIDHPEYVNYAFTNSNVYEGNEDIEEKNPDAIARDTEKLVDSTGFEASEGFVGTSTTSQYYLKSTCNTNLSWSLYNATASTTNKISGSQSMRLTVAKESQQIAQFFMTEDVYNLSRITFKAKGSTSGLKLHVMYSLDSGLNYSEGQTFDLTTSAKSFEYTLSGNGGYEKARIGFCFSNYSTSGLTYVNIDDLSIYRKKDLPDREFSRLSTKASLAYNYVNNYYEEEDSYYELLTNLEDLTNGSKIIIKALDEDCTLGEVKTNNFGIVDITEENGIISNPLTSTEITVGEGSESGTISLSVNKKYMGNETAKSNYLKLYSTLSDKTSWNISLDSETNVATLTIASDSVERNQLGFNSSNRLFSCYASSSSARKDILIYVKKSGNVIKCNTDIDNVRLKFGAVLDKELFDDILESDSNATFGIALSKDGINYMNYECNPAQVSYVNGLAQADDLGNYYQFAVVLPTNSEHYDSKVYAKVYVIINENTYYMGNKDFSVKELAKYYKDNASALGLSEEEIVSLGRLE